jgi:hypothetical protein
MYDSRHFLNVYEKGIHGHSDNLSLMSDKGLILSQIPLLSAKDKQTTILNLLRFEMRKTRLQFKRLEEDWQAQAQEEVKSSETQTEYIDRTAGLFADIHFLLVCLKKLKSIFLRMQKYFPESKELKRIEDRYGKLLGYCSKMRDDLEHIDDRPGKGVIGLGSTFGTIFQFGKRQLNLDADFHAKIETFYKELDSTYDEILKKRRKESGEGPVILTGVVTIPGPPSQEK